MRFFVLLCVLACSVFPLHAQEGYDLKVTLPVKSSEAFSVDQFGSIYLIRDSELLKLGKDGQEVYSFSNPILGEIYQVDVLNPLNPYVFYKDANQLVVIDNRLNESTSLTFTDFGFLDVQFLSFSDQENVWFYDQVTDKLYRFNIPQKKQTNKTVNITQLIGSENKPQGMVSTIENVYLNVPKKGIYVFDAVGAYRQTIPITGLEAFDVYGKTLYGIKGGRVVVYDLETGRLLPVLFTEEKLTGVHFSGEALYLFDGKNLKLYQRSGKLGKGR